MYFPRFLFINDGRSRLVFVQPLLINAASLGLKFIYQVPSTVSSYDILDLLIDGKSVLYSISELVCFQKEGVDPVLPPPYPRMKFQNLT